MCALIDFFNDGYENSILFLPGRTSKHFFFFDFVHLLYPNLKMLIQFKQNL